MISLHGVQVIGQGVRDLHIEGRTTADFHFDNAIAFSGLINSHDHLDFNLFPRLGNRIYANCVEWGEDIHKTHRSAIESILKIPRNLRTQWGVYKNLFNGVTTVANHGERLQIDDPVIDVLQCNTLHSVRQEPHWKVKLNKPFAGSTPFVVHAGEGTDRESTRDIDALIRWNLFRKELIAVHGVAMTEDQAGAFSAVVWCPDSNYFLLNTTADIPRLQKRTKVVFGTDSTLTASWNLWEQLRLARKLGMMTDETLFESVTTIPAAVWRLPARQGDIVVAETKGHGLEAWFDINPRDILLVIQDGKVRLVDETVSFPVAKFSKVVIQGSTKYVQGDVPGLTAEIRRYAPEVEIPGEGHQYT